MRYTVVHPSQRRHLKAIAKQMWSRAWKVQYNFLLDKEESNTRALYRDRNWSNKNFKAEVGASFFWWGITYLLGAGNRFTFITRGLALDSFAHALYFRFPILLRRYVWWWQLSIILAGTSVICFGLLHYFHLDIGMAIDAFRMMLKWLMKVTSSQPNFNN